LKYGQLRLKTLNLVPPVGAVPPKVSASLDGTSIPATLQIGPDGASIVFDSPLTIPAGKSLVVTLQ
jgi:hypothetical protein